MSQNKSDKEALRVMLEQPGQESPLSVPDGYFDQLQKNLHQKIGFLAGSDNSASSTFNTPDGYFETLPAKIMRRIASSDPKVISIGTLRLRAVLAVAAIITLVMLVNKSLTPDAETHRGEQFVTIEELQNSSYWDDLDEDVLAEAVLNETSSENLDIQEYLIESNVDISQIDIEL